jgi:hypothetical protein
MSILNAIKNLFGGNKPQAAPAANPDPTPQKSSEQYYLAGIEEERAVKDRYLRMDAYSPITNRIDFAGLDYYPPDPAYRLALPLQPAETEETLIFQTSTGDEQSYRRLGTITFDVEGQPASLAVYQALDHPGLFLPFRDATSDTETYGAGRYLEPHDLGGGELLVDFNLAYNGQHR